MSWNYAELSRMAKLAGGPEKYVGTLYRAGQQSMYPLMGGAIGLTIGITAIVTVGICSYIDWVSKEDQAKAADAIIDGIKNYDSENQDNTDD